MYRMLKLSASKYSNVMGLSKDLKLKGNDFSNAGSAFWIAVLLAEIPNGSSKRINFTSSW